ncbi:putative oxoglutarate iron-dependent oxygenase protein [Neofusicoccum parvum UCRNP2]|uniref:Oxoglutarate/iron-dependent oxygenase n=2 Tax=Neofusicoccum parvum TaxID=310453 RepID=A0ACB5SD59_9PEZI|nr:putative oxoglutarate iron-dependent oxygenase protein [Neofusicoccum parvum UCRNP2]GME35612.1 Oxoglutarate/iron-dependent oxygenase [Neofusicoccum parvum]
MCGNSSRLSTGGTIAVLRPPPHESPASPVADCNLFFENPAGRTARTRVVFQAQDGSCFDHFMGYFMLIHRTGDLLSRPPLSEEARNALYAVQLKPAVDEHQSTAQLELTNALDFSVGGNGVIGRKVSIVTDLNDTGATLAEGIIGWN